MFAELEAAALRSYPRAVSLEPGFAELLPEVTVGVSAAAFAEIAAATFTPRPTPTVGTDHLHAARVSVPEQAERLLEALERRGVGQWASFSELVADCTEPILIVGRFLALLELYRARAVTFEQSEPLGAQHHYRTYVGDHGVGRSRQPWRPMITDRTDEIGKLINYFELMRGSLHLASRHLVGTKQ